jgi:hypothetical protein
VNNPGSVSMRMPRLARRLSLERMFSVFLGTMGKSRAWHRSRVCRGLAASSREGAQPGVAAGAEQLRDDPRVEGGAAGAERPRGRSGAILGQRDAAQNVWR